MNRIALIEDEPPLSQHYTAVLSSAGYSVTPFLDRDSAEKGLEKGNFDAWVLDLNLDSVPTAGIGLIGWAIKLGIKVPILVVSGLDMDPHGHISMELGVWDFVSKPIDDRTLVFKIQQLLNAYPDPICQLPIVPNLDLDQLDPGPVKWNNRKLNIPLTSWKILLKLIASPDEVVSYDELYACVGTGRNKANVRQHVSTLRAEFESIDKKFEHIQVKVTEGYFWQL